MPLLLVRLETHLHSVSFHYKGAMQLLKGAWVGAEALWPGLGVVCCGGWGFSAGPLPPPGWLSSPPASDTPHPLHPPLKGLCRVGCSLLAPCLAVLEGKSRRPVFSLKGFPLCSWAEGQSPQPGLSLLGSVYGQETNHHKLCGLSQGQFIISHNPGGCPGCSLLVGPRGTQSFLALILPAAGPSWKVQEGSRHVHWPGVGSTGGWGGTVRAHGDSMS